METQVLEYKIVEVGGAQEVFVRDESNYRISYHWKLNDLAAAGWRVDFVLPGVFGDGYGSDDRLLLSRVANPSHTDPEPRVVDVREPWELEGYIPQEAVGQELPF
jgi:hypothetical protein